MKTRRKLYRETGVKFYLGGYPTPYQKKLTEGRLTTLKKMSEWKSGVLLRVVYQRGVENSGTFFSKASLLEAQKIWTEPNLVEYCTTGDWS